jgi:integrating conjugative element protein (TIGR03758 family)
MSLSATQEAAFRAASGGPATANVMLGIASIVLFFAVVWLAWAGVRFFEDWRTGQAEFASLVWNVLRGTMLVSVLIYYIR